MTDKNEVGYWIKRKGHEKFSETAPEVAFKRFVDSLGYVVTKGEPIWMDGWRLTPDFDMKLGKLVNIVILIDGRYHFTEAQEKKDRWRDEMYSKALRKVIHIDAGLTTNKKYWPYLRMEFLKAVIGSAPVTYIHE
jgi:hypothetical protein